KDQPHRRAGLVRAGKGQWIGREQSAKISGCVEGAAIARLGTQIVAQSLFVLVERHQVGDRQILEPFGGVRQRAIGTRFLDGEAEQTIALYAGLEGLAIVLRDSWYPGQGRKAGIAMEREVRKAKKLPPIDAIRCGDEGRNRVYGIGVSLDPLAKSVGL